MQQYLVPVGDKDVRRMYSLCEVFNESSMRVLNRHNAKSFLDIGCGPGGLIIPYAMNNPFVKCVGVDNSQEQLDIAKRIYDNCLIETNIDNNMGNSIQFILGDARNLDFGGLTFDIVHTRFVLTHLQDPISAAEHLLTLVSPGGVLIMEEMNGNDIKANFKARSLDAWKDAFVLQHIIQKSSLETGIILKNYFDKGESEVITGLYDTPSKKLVFVEGARIAVDKLVKSNINPKDNPIDKYGFIDGEEWIKEAMEIQMNDSCYFTSEMCVVTVKK